MERRSLLIIDQQYSTVFTMHFVVQAMLDACVLCMYPVVVVVSLLTEMLHFCILVSSSGDELIELALLNSIQSNRSLLAWLVLHPTRPIDESFLPCLQISLVSLAFLLIAIFLYFSIIIEYVCIFFLFLRKD